MSQKKSNINVEFYSGAIISIPCGRHKVDARFFNIVEDAKYHREKPVILRLHGTLGNLLDETEFFLPEDLARKNYSSLTMNTLLSNLGLFFGFGIFDDVMRQIDTACEYLKQEGFKKIVIAGHGVGSCMATRYAALSGYSDRGKDIVGVISIATPYSLPQTVLRRWKKFGSEPSYEEMNERANHAFLPPLGTKPAPDEIVVVKRARGHSRQPKDSEVYTLKTWWVLAGPYAEGTKVYKNVSKIKVPILFIHGLRDSIIEASEFERLGEAAREEGNTDVTQVAIDADHDFNGKHDELSGAIINWLEQRFK